ncbi:MAG: 3-phosphoshikimate 1-carboxyvinyltransferase, partial [Thermoplasmatota archaeon]
TNPDPGDAPGDRAILPLLPEFGASVIPRVDGATVRGGPLAAVDLVDLSDTPDLFPALCALAARARGTTTLAGGEHLRFKESDRIAAMARNLGAMGVRCEERKDGLIVHGGTGELNAATLATEGDHRILMASAVLALVARGETHLDHPEAAAVSFPGFDEAMRGLGAHVSVVA